MRTLTPVLLILAVLAVPAASQIPDATLRQIQEVPFDSLVAADALQNTVPARWTLQRAPAPYYGDTVTVTAVCVVPAKQLTFTAGGFTMLLADTGANPLWGWIFVRVNAPADTNQIILDGFLNVERGDLIRMTGIVSDFPLTSMNSATQFQPVAGRPIQILGTAPVPGYRRMEIGDFHRGIFPGGSVRYSTGEPMEAGLVEFVNLRVDARVNTARGTFSVVDGAGNQITMYDASRFFTLGHGGTTPFPADSLWNIIYPPVGAQIDTLRGYITTVSGGENPRGYRIAPIFRNDVAIGIVLPSITTHRRNPIIVPPDSAARITVRVTRQSGGFPLAAVELVASSAGAPFTTSPMTFDPADSLHKSSIPQQAEGTLVRYFIQAVDSAGNRATLASSAFGGAASDTSQGTFFYTVTSGPLSIRDLQYTPFRNGRTPYLGAVTTVAGVVTADTASLLRSPASTGGTNAWYIQSGADPWSGIWVVGIETTMVALRNGDSVSVTGFVEENFDVTRLSNNTTPVTVLASGLPLPAPVVLQTSVFGPTIGNGTPSAEQVEGMLIRFNNVTVTSIDPTFGNEYEFEVDDGSGPVLVRRDGTHLFSNVPADSAIGKTVLRVGDRISFLTGVGYYSFNRYKIVPRSNADFGAIVNSVVERDDVQPSSFVLEQNYPNPFNPSTTITYDLPEAARVTLTVTNVLGQTVRTLAEGVQEAGRYRVRFDAGGLSTGVYFTRLQAGERVLIRKMLLLK